MAWNYAWYRKRHPQNGAGGGKRGEGTRLMVSPGTAGDVIEGIDRRQTVIQRSFVYQPVMPRRGRGVDIGNGEGESRGIH